MLYSVQSLNANRAMSDFISEESHLKVLRLLEANPELTQRELADALGVSVGKTNYCVRALLDKGLLKMKNFRNSNNKLAYAYLLTPAGLAAKTEMTTEFLRRKLSEYEALKLEIEQLQREATHHASSNFLNTKSKRP